MPRSVRFDDAFEQEFLAPRREVQDELLASAKLLADYGPGLGRPYADTLKGSKHAKHEGTSFRCRCRPAPAGHSLVAGNKSGVSKGRFCKRLIAKADKRYSAHLERLKRASGRG